MWLLPQNCMDIWVFSFAMQSLQVAMPRPRIKPPYPHYAATVVQGINFEGLEPFRIETAGVILVCW